jgi:F-box domain
MQQFPLEIIISILSHIPLHQVFTLSKLCKIFRDICKFKPFLYNYYPDDSLLSRNDALMLIIVSEIHKLHKGTVNPQTIYGPPECRPLPVYTYYEFEALDHPTLFVNDPSKTFTFLKKEIHSATDTNSQDSNQNASRISSSNQFTILKRKREKSGLDVLYILCTDHFEEMGQGLLLRMWSHLWGLNEKSKNSEESLNL